MHMLIAHRSKIAQAKIYAQLKPHFQGLKSIARTSLTETYDLAEHHSPDCVIVGGDLAATPEFELLSTLFNIIGIGCVIHGAERGRTTSIANYPVVAEACTDHEMADAVRNAVGQSQSTKSALSVHKMAPMSGSDPKKIVLIGASTGGVDALCRVLQHFSARCPPTLIVQHTGGGFAGSLIKLLNGATAAEVHEAQSGFELQAGHIYLTPDGRSHLLLKGHRQPQIDLRKDELISGHRPSIDALFQSASRLAPNIVAALLTGMGRDGAQGLANLRRDGAHTIGQDQATSVVYGMPRVAMELGGVKEQLPIDEIGPAILRATLVRARA